MAARGIERRRLFDEEREWERFLAQLAGGVELDGVRLYLFCLMINRVHLVLETPRAKGNSRNGFRPCVRGQSFGTSGTGTQYRSALTRANAARAAA